MPPLTPTPWGQGPTQGLWGLSCSSLTIQLLPLLPWHARHSRPGTDCKVTCSVRARPGTAGPALGPQGVALTGNVALLSYTDKLEAQKQWPTCLPHFLEGRSLGKQRARCKQNSKGEKQTPWATALPGD